MYFYVKLNFSHLEREYPELAKLQRGWGSLRYGQTPEGVGVTQIWPNSRGGHPDLAKLHMGVGVTKTLAKLHRGVGITKTLAKLRGGHPDLTNSRGGGGHPDLPTPVMISEQSLTEYCSDSLNGVW